jgi:hypothetical protein
VQHRSLQHATGNPSWQLTESVLAIQAPRESTLLTLAYNLTL